MRKAGPILILIIGVAALLIDLFPGLRVPDSTSPDGSWRPIETKLGLGLEGGLRVEYQALPKDGQPPPAASRGVLKETIERRGDTTGVSEPDGLTQGADRGVRESPPGPDVHTGRDP